MTSKHAIVTQLQGITLVAKADSNHWVTMDGSELFGGSNAGPTPKELLLCALGGCTASDVIPILKKKRSPVDRVEIRLTGELREEHPQIFTSIHIEYIVYGDGVDPADVERAIELSTTRYCAISAMLSPTVRLTHSMRIVAPEMAVPA